MKKFFATIWVRLKSSTPPLFRKIRAIGNTLTATGTAVAANGAYKEGGIMVGAGLIVSFLASLVSTDSTEDINQQVTNKISIK